MEGTLPKRKSVRLPSYDYTSGGAYFVTICAHQRKKRFGKICRGDLYGRPRLEISALGQIAKEAFIR